MEFDSVYREHADAVFRFLLKLSGDEQLAEEFTQECFYRAYVSRDSYNGNCKITVWLCQIAKNIYFDYCRKKKPIPLDEEYHEGSQLEELFSDRDVYSNLHRILHNLDEPYKEVFTLRVFSELSYRDIAELFSRTESWVRVIFHRAKIRIIETYNNKDI